MGRNNAATGPYGMMQTRMKAETPAWGGNGRNTTWDEMGSQSVGWDEPSSFVKQKMSNRLWDNEVDWMQKPNKLHLNKVKIYKLFYII